MTDEATATIETIDSVFEGDDATGDTATEVTEAKAAEETKAADTKVEAATGEDDAETPSEEEKSVPIAALKDERRKRQEAEERLKAYEQKSKEEERAPDPVEDPEGYATFMETKQSKDSLTTKINLSRDIMIDANPDYEDAEKVFIDLAKENPYLVRKMHESPNPARFAYKTAKEHLEIQKYKDPKYRETLEAELREKILKEMSEKPTAKAKKSAVEVPDLTKATAAGSNSTPEEKLEDLSDIMKGSPF